VATLLAPLGGEQWTGGSTHAIRFRVSDETDVQLAAWVNATVDGVPAALYAGPVPLGESSVAWALPSSTSTATVLVTVADASGLTASSSSAALAIDATPPALLAVDPADGAVSASVAGPVVLTFSERMNEAATAAAIAMTPSVGGMSASWDPGGRVLTIAFTSPLAAYTEYTVTVGCAAHDGSDPGNALAGCPGAPARIRFTTEIVAPTPIAVAAAVSDVRVGSPVGFDGRGSTGEIATWAWTVTDAAGAVVATLDGPTATHTFSEPGTYRVTLRVTDAFGRTDEYSFDVSVLSVGGSDGSPWVLVVGGAAVLAAILFAASEPGRVAIVTATAARVYGRKPKDEKDSEIRGAILYYVRVHPGDTYMDVKRNLDLNDGVVTYHLARLEKDGLVRSAIQGARKRYYPAGMRVPVENGGELHEIQQRILRFVVQEPGMPVAVLAEQLGVSGQLALYHLRKLAQGQQVDLERAGLRLRAYPGRPGK
jgi:DNA-binding transcriptional ArsR family regulator/PKD repeat protein